MKHINVCVRCGIVEGCDVDKKKRKCIKCHYNCMQDNPCEIRYTFCEDCFAKEVEERKSFFLKERKTLPW